MMPKRVLIAEDDPDVRDGLALLVGLEDDFRVIGQAENGLQVIEAAFRLTPDVVLMDIHMPFCDGLEATRKIKSKLPGIKIIILSVHTHKVGEAITAGASNFIPKDSPPEIIYSAIRAS